MAKIYYLLKTKGTSKIPDFIQIRDEHFVLLTHTRADKPEVAVEEAGLGIHTEAILKLIENLLYGEMQQITL